MLNYVLGEGKVNSVLIDVTSEGCTIPIRTGKQTYATLTQLLLNISVVEFIYPNTPKLSPEGGLLGLEGLSV